MPNQESNPKPEGVEEPRDEGLDETACYGALVNALLDDAFQVLQHDTGETDPEWHAQRKWLADKFKKTLRSKKRHNSMICGEK